ncbi:hypothetical protein PIB30_059484 [Stylosanthes scabra]|uniref:CCHC-type domain-containing protein n=1 Tax=Stylosanthes scabra TaxID=79078 RepID=A0ABU6RK86_9FABA|nr:hypothetical protein [Stylosanthes scabra]
MGNPEGVSILEAGRNEIIVSFKDRGRGIQILKNSSWWVKGCLLNLQQWSQHEALSEVDLDQMEFWVQMHGVPLEMMNSYTARKIGNEIGVVTDWEDLVKGHDCYCLTCGIIGHNRKECNKRMAMSVIDPKKPRYGPGLGVNQARSLSSLYGRKGRRQDHTTAEEGEQEAREDQGSFEGVGTSREV